MLSKNNRQEQFRKQEPKKQRFAIKKLTVGVASVLIGFTFMGVNAASADADTTPARSGAPETTGTANSSSNQSSDEAVLTPASASDATSSASSANSTENMESPVADAYAEKVEADAAAAQNNDSSAQASEAPADSNETTTFSVPTDTPTVTPMLLGESKLEETPTQVNDLQSFTGALVNKNVHQIQLTSDIEFGDGTGQTNLVAGGSGLIAANGLAKYEMAANKTFSSPYNNIAHTVVIDGQGHSLNMGKTFISLWNQNYGDEGWNITFKNVIINQENESYSPIYFGNASWKNQANTSLTFDGVTANIKRTLNTNDARGVAVHFVGDNTVNALDMVKGANAVNGATVDFSDGTTTFNLNGKTADYSLKATNDGNWAIHSDNNDGPSTTINEGATVNINAMADDLRGIYAGRQTTAGQPIYGETIINGTLNADMQKGHSTAIWSHDLKIGEQGVVKINTKQDNQADGTEDSIANAVTNYNGTHYAPISLGMGPITSVASPLTKQKVNLINEGSLTVIRDNDNKTLVPLISMGDGGVSTNTTMHLEVQNGATLDLQDNSNTFLQGTEPNSPYTGLITMWGTSGVDEIIINKPEYLNLQRTGGRDNRGTLIRLEGVNNSVTVNGTTPVAQWDQGNMTNTPSDAWYVDYLKTINQWGNNSGTFLGKNQNLDYAIAHKGVDTLYNSKADLIMAENQGGDKYEQGTMPSKVEEALHLNSFLNNFNWWRPQRIAMGSKLNPIINDADKYQPETQTINGNTGQTLNDLNANDGVKDLVGPNGVVAKDGIVTNVTWYNSATDKTQWDKIMIQPTESKNPADLVAYPEPQNPTGNLKTTDTSAWAKVTYADGTVDFVNIPLNISERDTDAATYEPTTKDISTNQGTTPEADSAITNKNTDTVPEGTQKLPEGTKYTWADPAKVAEDVNNPGVHRETVTVTYPDNSTDTVETNVTVDALAEAKTITTTVGGNPAASEGIANLKDNVPGYPTSAEWTTAPDTSKAGLTGGTVTVTYPDGTTQTVDVPVAVNDGNHEINIVDDKGHSYSLSVRDVVSHKTSDTNLIGNPVVETVKLSYYKGGQNYSKPFIYALGTDGDYHLTQEGDFLSTGNQTAPATISGSAISAVWTPAGDFNNVIPGVQGNGQPTTVASDDNNGTKTIIYDKNQNTQGTNGYVYPKYVVTVDTSNVEWPIFGKGPQASHPFPSVSIYGAEANGTVPNIYSDSTDVKKDLGEAKNYVDISALTPEHNATITSIEWQETPDISVANNAAPATVRINFADGTHLDVPITVNVIKVDQGIDNTTDRDLYRDITRTISIEGVDDPVVQHVIYSRAKTTNLAKPAGEQVSYSDWVAAKDSQGNEVTSFPEYEVTKPGYTATAIGDATITTRGSQQFVSASAKITPDSANQAISVTYTANEHTLVINYVDRDGNKIGSSYDVPGRTAETVDVDVPSHVPANWQLVPGQTIMSSITFGSDDPAAVSYTVEHKTETVDVDRNNRDTYREVKQTINETLPGQTTQTVRTYTVPFERTGVKDLVTNEITWNAWQGPTSTIDGNFTIPEYTFTGVNGYDTYIDGSKVDTNVVPAETVNADSSDKTYDITFVRQGATPVPYDPSSRDMNMSVTRTINYVVPEGYAAISPEVQTVNYARNTDGVAGYQDPVTGEITWNPWTVVSGTAEFPEADVAQIDGYDSYVNNVKSTKVTAAAVTELNGTPQNGEDVTVTYQSNETPVPDTTVTYTFHDDTDDKTVGIPVIVTGKPGTSQATNLTVPAGYKLANGQTLPVSVTMPGADTAVIIHLVHDTKDVTPTTPGVDPTNPKYSDMFTTVTRDIYQTKPGQEQAKIATQSVEFGRNGVEDLVTGEVKGTGTWEVGKTEDNVFVPGGNAEFAEAAVEQLDGYDSFVNGEKATTVKAESALDNGQPVNGQAAYITYEAADAGETPVPYDPSNADMNKYVTRTITINEPGKDPQTTTQTVHFVRGGVGQAAGQKDKDGNITWADWTVANDNNESTGAKTGTWNEFDAPSVDGYTASPAKVEEVNNVTPETTSVDVAINYTKNATDADKYTPEGQDIKTPEGQVPDASEGIKNKGDLPEGTKYEWADPDKVTEDVKTPGSHEETITVTYPDGSKDTVTVTVNVPAPEGQEITTDQGKLPNASDAIKNKDQMPEGTTYTWKQAPDVTTPGDHTGVVRVTFPDGSTYDVTVTVHVNEPQTTDADKYTPEAQPITTPEGQVPDASEGIKNKSDLPEGTKYEWADPAKVAQDVKTPGSHEETITVTYPDGSKDTVTVTVNVPAPEGQEVTTDQGKLPNASDAIKNKDQMLEGTTYTWKQAPDVTTPGDHTGVVRVTFPDGSTYDVTVTVHVNEPQTGNATNTPAANTATVKTTGTNATATPKSSKQASAKTLPQTGNNNSETAAVLGLGLASLAGMFGLGRKKRLDK